MSPILVRPVREQLEHDRVIRLLHSRFRRRYEVGINPASEQNVAVGSGSAAIHPDVVLFSPQRGRRLQGVIEVETTESVSNLEALAQWSYLARQRAPFHLYVPAGSVDVARRLCTEHQISVAEIWSYHAIGDQLRFTMVYRAPAPSRATARAASARARATKTDRRKAAGSAATKSAGRRAPKTPPRKAAHRHKRK